MNFLRFARLCFTCSDSHVKSWLRWPWSDTYREQRCSSNDTRCRTHVWRAGCDGHGQTHTGSRDVPAVIQGVGHCLTRPFQSVAPLHHCLFHFHLNYCYQDCYSPLNSHLEIQKLLHLTQNLIHMLYNSAHTCVVGRYVGTYICTEFKLHTNKDKYNRQVCAIQFITFERNACHDWQCLSCHELSVSLSDVLTSLVISGLAVSRLSWIVCVRYTDICHVRVGSF